MFSLCWFQYWYVLYFSLCFCRVYIHIGLQLLAGSSQIPIGSLPLYPAREFPGLCSQTTIGSLPPYRAGRLPGFRSQTPIESLPLYLLGDFRGFVPRLLSGLCPCTPLGTSVSQILSPSCPPLANSWLRPCLLCVHFESESSEMSCVPITNRRCMLIRLNH